MMILSFLFMMILSLWQQRHSLPLDKKSRAAYSVCPAFKVHMKLAVLSRGFLFGIGPVAGAFAAVDSAEFIPDFHQCKAEHVLAFPVARISCFFVVGGCADAQMVSYGLASTMRFSPVERRKSRSFLFCVNLRQLPLTTIECLNSSQTSCFR